MPKKSSPVTIDVESRILTIRGRRVVIDADLAQMYSVQTKALNQALKRNSDRFPEDFAFRLTKQEKEEVVTNCDHLARLKFSPTLPYVFSEHGAIMAANVLNSSRAIEMSVHVVRAFVRLREMVGSHRELAKKLDELERKVSNHDQAIAGLIDAIRELMAPPQPPKRKRIGFIQQD